MIRSSQLTQFWGYKQNSKLLLFMTYYSIFLLVLLYVFLIMFFNYLGDYMQEKELAFCCIAEEHSFFNYINEHYLSYVLGSLFVFLPLAYIATLYEMKIKSSAFRQYALTGIFWVGLIILFFNIPRSLDAFLFFSGWMIRDVQFNFFILMSGILYGAAWELNSARSGSRNIKSLPFITYYSIILLILLYVLFIMFFNYLGDYMQETEQIFCCVAEEQSFLNYIDERYLSYFLEYFLVFLVLAYIAALYEMKSQSSVLRRYALIGIGYGGTLILLFNIPTGLQAFLLFSGWEVGVIPFMFSLIVGLGVVFSLPVCRQQFRSDIVKLSCYLKGRGWLSPKVEIFLSQWRLLPVFILMIYIIVSTTIDIITLYSE